MIKLDELIKILKDDENFHEIIVDGCYHYDYDKNIDFNKLSYDSRLVDENTLFFAKGLNFRKEFLEGAINKGLKFYISEIDYEVDIPAIIVSNIKHAMSLVAQKFYDYPQNSLKILAFTGTKGKTTAAYFAKNILELSSKQKTAMLSTMNTTLDGVNYFKSALTTPESLDLFQMMAQARDNGMTHLVMEVSSQAYKTARVYGLTFDVGVFLNISPDHIGPIEHPTFEDYFYCKRQLLHNSKFVVANSDMDQFSVIKEELKNKPAAFYGDNSENKITNSNPFNFSTSGTFNETFSIELLGKFNQENALAAALACKELGATTDDVLNGIAQTTVPGRMEVFKQANGARVYVDYAHNGVSLANLLNVVKGAHKGNIYLILGAPGNKGESRREDFGHLLNDEKEIHVILSADDPNFENPADIAKQIAQFIERPIETIIDREEAIKEAMSRTLSDSDAVIIAGKGADAYQIVDGAHAEYAGDHIIAQKYL
ncbi:UDP-N-acetylmuramoyl-L-alanyl-D-glutamate--2,6-diaminopimelate ligase [Floricoccus penangensis]|uniref:UDP-N-acetylmuramoyl-L-alanyl-D-glutamate--L-lysine ligase n=1 Tax=Floricoccus penangensis TaxID=1859475 RepID=A0A9Q5P048_9LACT|nr:UDP-N-acetylmuramoyl-L-alanyl-D-glutamate--L-lysine ligase [Floricoccus penangensis]OFI46472.1 UDP-N-acetylmuramoyl-L-alanyl-D-glutamate--2,6-diaminopimelate ligase [Floricoccus penangensis]